MNEIELNDFKCKKCGGQEFMMYIPCSVINVVSYDNINGFYRWAEISEPIGRKRKETKWYCNECGTNFYNQKIIEEIKDKLN